MSEATDQTQSMSEAGTTDLGAAMRSFISGKEAPSVSNAPEVEREVFQNTSSNLQDLEDRAAAQLNSTTETESSQEPTPEEVTAADEMVGQDTTAAEDFLELKVKGFREPQKITKNWEDPKVQELLNKGLRFESRMQELAKQRKELESKLSLQQDYADKAEVAGRVEAAKALIEKGYTEQALSSIMGESAESMIESLVEKRIRYQNASPEERLQMDLERQKSEKDLSEQRHLDRIAKLEAQMNERSDKLQADEYRGYIEDAKSRYDLSQWVSDPEDAQYLNETLESRAFKDLVGMQRQRESRGETNISSRDVRRVFAGHVKKLLKATERQSTQMADQKISQQSETAKKNAQIASTKNYGTKESVESLYKQSGGSMAALVDMLRPGRGIR